MNSDSGGTPAALAEAEFLTAVIEAETPVLVAFSAQWCAPCAWLEPYLRELDEEFGDRARIYKVDADESPELVRRHRVASVPTVILFSAGEEVGRSLGIEPDRLREMLAGTLEAGKGSA